MLGWLAGGLLYPPLDSADLRFVTWVSRHRSAGWTAFAKALSIAGQLAILIAACAAAAVWLCVRRRFADIVTLALAVAGAKIISDAVKVLVDRPRPPIVHLVRVTSASFPSGHATQTAAIVPVLALVLTAGTAGAYRRLALAGAILFVIAVGWSRVYLGVHYASDVVAGWLLGGAWALVVLSVRRAGRRTPSAPAAAVRS
jgi:membrane-associated phospholipid phosphatase